MAVHQYVNNAQTTLSGSITAGATSLSVASGSAFPTQGKFTIIVDNEIMLVTGVAGTTWTVTRGQEGTTAASHNNNAAVTAILTVDSFLNAKQFDVRAYGAKGDGTTDDSPAIQAALTAAYDAGGGQVFVPDGTYRLNTQLIIKANTRLTLSPKATMQRYVTSLVTIVNGESGATAGGYTGHGNILIEGGIWDQRGTQSAVGNGSCFGFHHGENIIVRNVTVKNQRTTHGVDITGCKNVKVLDSRFTGWVDTGDIPREAIQIDLSGATHFPDFGPYDNTPCYDIEVRGCYFGASGDAGTVAFPRGVGTHSSDPASLHQHIRVLGNHFDGITDRAVNGEFFSHFIVSNNTFTGCGSGIRIEGISGSTNNTIISGNVFQNTTGVGPAIDVDGNSTYPLIGIAISHNTVLTVTSQPGIRAAQARRIMVVGNTVSGSDGNGIIVYQSEDVTVSGNTVRNPGGVGIFVSEGLIGGSVTGNNVYGAGTNGIQLGNSVTASQGISCVGNTVAFSQQHGIVVSNVRAGTVANNTIVASSQATTNTSNHVDLSTSAQGITITGNRTDGLGLTKKAKWGFSATGTCLTLKRFGNYWTGWVTAGVNDLSTTPDTTSGDTSV